MRQRSGYDSTCTHVPFFNLAADAQQRLSGLHMAAQLYHRGGQSRIPAHRRCTAAVVADFVAVTRD
jgi:hypothetical protein